MAVFKADILGMKLSFTPEILRRAPRWTLCGASPAAGTRPRQPSGNPVLQKPLSDATSISPRLARKMDMSVSLSETQNGLHRKESWSKLLAMNPLSQWQRVAKNPTIGGQKAQAKIKPLYFCNMGEIIFKPSGLSPVDWNF